MKNSILMAGLVVFLLTATASATVQTLVYAETKNICVGSSGYPGGGYGNKAYNVNYSTDTGYGYRIGLVGETDMSIMDLSPRRRPG